MPTREYVVTEEDFQKAVRICSKMDMSQLNEDHPVDYCYNCILAVCFERHHPERFFDINDESCYHYNHSFGDWEYFELSDGAKQLMQDFDEYITSRDDPNCTEPYSPPELPVTLHENLNLKE